MDNGKEQLTPAHSSTTNYPLLAKLAGFACLAGPLVAVLLVSMGILHPSVVAPSQYLLFVRIAAVIFTLISLPRPYRSEEQLLKAVREKRQRPEQVYMLGAASGTNALGGGLMILFAGGSVTEFYGFAAISIAAWIVWQRVWSDKKEMYERAFNQPSSHAVPAS